ncbi:hypothetical protein PVAND_003643 [Polypedilum vanderplanki]|uniref:RING-type domain-containing protein n=1 Tax=Polypedilum vanderplanki TaxID=319348 RepID=A0A9J6BWI2_POLVA|nr:hypothetical protein PVAND_003643 [Polypedilum vanderplanki]
MPLQNIIGMMIPLTVVVGIGALVIGLFYRERQNQYEYSDFTGSDFRPDMGYDTGSCSNIKKKDEDEERCIICIDSMKRCQALMTLPCAHKFHKKCIITWLRFEHFCPICRTVVP